MAAISEAKDVDLEEVDLLDMRWFAVGTPHALFERMRAEAPVRWNRTADGGGFWSLTRHADVSAVSRDTGTFSSHRKGIFLNPDQVAPLDVVRNVLLYKDPPEHTRYRKILNSAFTPHTVSKLEGDVRALVTRRIDAFIEAGRCEFVHDLAVPIPLAVLASLMGLPESDIPRLYEWTEQIEQAQRSPEPAQAVETFGELAGYLHEQVEAQTKAGGDSLVMAMRTAEVEGEKLDDAEILTFFALLVFAGNDTTRNTTATGMLALLEDPGQLELLREDPSRIPNAVEELLRWTSVVRYFIRTATQDTEIAGQAIAEGDKVMLWYASASRDGDVFDDPQRLDVLRPKPDHKAFGGGGRHFCLGAGLARLELKVIFEEVTRRLQDIELAGDPERLPSPWAHGLTALPLSFTPGRRESA